jgi:deoxyribose-phosphate aldolase
LSQKLPALIRLLLFIIKDIVIRFGYPPLPRRWCEAPEVAQSATVTVNEAKRVEAVKGEDYKMYIEAMGGVNSDELFAQYKKERAAYMANPSSATPTVVSTATATNEEMKIASYKENDYNLYVKATGGISNDAVHIKFNQERNTYLGTANTVTVPSVTPTATNEEMKIASYKENDYNLYVKATGGISNDAVHIKFNQERNTYLGTAGSVTPTSVEPTTQVKPQKPSATYNRNSVKKPSYRTIVKPSFRKMTIKVIRIYQY